MSEVLLLYPFFRWGNKGSGRRKSTDHHVTESKKQSRHLNQCLPRAFLVSHRFPEKARPWDICGVSGNIFLVLPVLILPAPWVASSLISREITEYSRWEIPPILDMFQVPKLLPATMKAPPCLWWPFSQLRGAHWSLNWGNSSQSVDDFEFP